MNGISMYFLISHSIQVCVKGEINALKWSDIDDNIIHVRRSIAQKLKGDARETPPKNKSSVRDLQMPLPLINIWSEHQKRYKAIDGYSDNLRICGGIKCLRDTTIEKRNEKFARYCKCQKKYAFTISDTATLHC